MKIPMIMAGMLLASAASGQHSLQVDISNFRNSKGVCRTCVYTSQENMETEKPLVCTVTSVKDRTAQARFDNLPAGNYTVLVFHDANNNKQFDTNFLGIPSEGYGASRNALPFAAAPTFKANMIHLKGPQGVRIRLRNL